MSGYNEEELLGRSHYILRHPDMPATAFKDLWDTVCFLSSAIAASSAAPGSRSGSSGFGGGGGSSAGGGGGW
jgi:uncharacterized membrane protein